MTKLAVILLVATFCLLGSSHAQQQSRARSLQRANRGRSRFLARQELAPDTADAAAVTPYPSADELKPEVPFSEAAPTPDAVYGPPDAVASKNVPDEVYGPPDVTANDLPAADVPAEQQARLVAARRLRPAAAAFRRVAARPAKLKVAQTFVKRF